MLPVRERARCQVSYGFEVREKYVDLAAWWGCAIFNGNTTRVIPYNQL